MFVWLHTSSPPQHIGHEAFGGLVNRLPEVLRSTNERRGLRSKVALIAHDERSGDDSIHIFDHEDRAVNWTQRNMATVEVVHIIHAN